MSGRGGMNPRQMQQAMKQMGIKQSNMDDAIEVVIRTPDKEIVITNPDVVVVDMKGSRSYQISGTEEIRKPGTAGAAAAPTASFPSGDIELVMSQTGCDREKAIKALEETKGQPAEAILKIMTS